MTTAALPKPRPIYVPLRLSRQSIGLRVAAVAGATLFLAICSWITVPMVPVPLTMQTFGVTVVGALFGWRLGFAAVAAWLIEGALGLPVFTGGTAGLAHMVGPTGGYLASFPIVAALVGLCAERGMTARTLWLSFAVMLVANLLILVMGAAWLAAFTGVEAAITLGVTPFLIGGVLKAALASAAIEAARRHIRR